MKKIAISVSALFLALGVLSGCGEKKEEAPQAEAPAATEAKPAEQAAAPAQEAAPAEQAAAPAEEAAPAEQAAQAAGDAAQAAGDAAQAAGEAVKEAAGDAAQAAGDAAQAAGEAVKEAAGDAMQAAGDAAQAAKEAAGDAVQAATGGADGEKVYKGLCFSCHDMGIANAPKLGDKEAWAPRIAAGMDAMHETALHGNPAKPAMPAKGGNPALSDEEVKAAVDWMVSQSQ